MKRKINLNRPKISAEEIAKRKNFDSVLKNSPGISGKAIFKKPWFLSGVAIATVAAIATAVMVSNRQPAGESANNKSLTDSLAKVAAFYKSEAAKPCVAPPLKGLDIPYSTFSVDADAGGEIRMPNGSGLKFPAHAFADNNGNILKGKIEIRYREFHDPMEIFVAGIPMTYDSAGVRYHFETAGMMEVLAFQDGKSVQMARGKTVDVQLASGNADPKFNLYALDTLHHNWACLGKDKIVKQTSAPAAPEIVADAKRKAVEEQTRVASQKLLDEKEIKIAALPKPDVAPLKPQKVRKDRHTFNLEVDKKEFPELDVYKGLLFEVGDENKSFSSAMYSVDWDNASIREGTVAGKNYLLTLMKGSKKYEMIVYPVYEGKNYETALQEYQERFNKYSAVLEKRKAEEQVIEEAYAKRLDALKKEQERVLREEIARENKLQQAMTNEEKVMRCFTISDFKIYNCDHPRQAPASAVCTGELKKDHDVNILCYSIYHVDKKEKGIYTYTRSPLRFGYDPAAENILWTVEDGVIYYLLPEDFAGLQKTNGKIVMRRAPDNFKSAEDLKNFFQL